jgi:hypothetical protein
MMNMISPELSEAIQAVAGLLSLFISIAAIFISIRVEARNSKRIQREQFEAKQIAMASVKPVLTIATKNYINLKEVQLVNHGPGTAVITKIVFSKNKKASKI